MNKHLVMTLSHYVDGAVMSNAMCTWLLRHLPRGTELCAKNLPPVKPAETVWLVNSSTLFTTEEHRRCTMRVLGTARIVVYVCNDYKLPFPSKWRHAVNPRARVVYLCTVRRWVEVKGGAVLDWNQLSWHPDELAARSRQSRGGLVYWGACRMDRRPLFQCWLRNFPGLVLTTTVKHQKSFAALGVESEVRRLTLPIDLRSYGGTLLLEDPYSLRNDTCPPNRFYEALCAGLAILAPAETWRGLARHGFDDGRHVLDAPTDIPALDNGRLREIAAEQRHWGRENFAAKLEREFRAACKQLELT